MVPIIANESVQRGRTSIKHCMFLLTVQKGFIQGLRGLMSFFSTIKCY